jgi:ABC-type Na+ efflux pump permease subunit
VNVDFRKIRLILKKEWLQLRQQRGLVLSFIFLPLLFVLIPLGVTFALGQAPTESLNGMEQLLEVARLNPALVGLSQE